MLFNSFIFWIFFALVLLIYRALPHTQQNRFLLLASYIFYGYWDYRFLVLLFISTAVTYYIVHAISVTHSPARRKRFLAISIVFNFGLLGFFKYYNFFAGEFATLLQNIGLSLPLPFIEVILPAGISFYTFQAVSYTVDVYRRESHPVKSFVDFALYKSFFPQLVAGPIERPGHLLPQILKPRRVTAENFSEGLYHVLFGLFKKVVVADNMAPIVNQIFSRPVSDLTGPEVLLGIYAFAFQIYGDFSGYSSIAQGIAKWMGFELSWNFKMPYFSSSPSEFWQRWHITLSAWLRDYLYIPLGGNRHGQLLTQRNLMITMLLGGLWHGAGWTFILWGFYHGLLLVLYRIGGYLNGLHGLKIASTRATRILAVILFFHLICISWLLFRAKSADQAWNMLVLALSDFTVTDLTRYGFAMLAFFVTPFMILELWIERSGDLLRVVNSHWAFKAMVYSYFIVMLWVFPPLTSEAFIYFQF